MNIHDDDSRRSLIVLPANEDSLIPNTDIFGTESIAYHYIKESLRPKGIGKLNEKELLLLNLYKKIGLTPEQKRDFHALLIRMSTVEDVINITKDIFNDIKDVICCSDKRCLCDTTNQFKRSSKSEYSNQITKDTFRKTSNDFEIRQLSEIKKEHKELVRIHKQLIKLRGIIKHDDEDLNNFVNLLLLRKDVAYNKESLFYLKEKLRRYD